MFTQEDDEDEIETGTMIVNKDVHDGTMMVNDAGTMVINSENDSTMVINSDQETLQSGMGTMVINDDDDDEGTMKRMFILGREVEVCFPPGKKQLDWLATNTEEITSQSHSLKTGFTVAELGFVISLDNDIMPKFQLQFSFHLGLGTTESKNEYRPSFMDHFDKMFESPQTTNHVNERKTSDTSTDEVVMRRTESPFSPPKKFGPGDFEFVSSHVHCFH